MDSRIFTSHDALGKEITLRFNKPTQKILTDADFAYKQHFSRCVRNGIMTSAEALKLVKDNELWAEVDEVKVRELRAKIDELEKRFDENLTEEQGKPLFAEIKKLRNELNDINSRLTSITENTAESMSGDYRIQYLAAACVVYNDTGKKVFASLEDLINRSDELVVADSTSETLIANFEHNLGIKLPDSGFILAENKWLKEIQAKEVTTKELEATQPVVIDGKPAKKKK